MVEILYADPQTVGIYRTVRLEALIAGSNGHGIPVKRRPYGELRELEQYRSQGIAVKHIPERMIPLSELRKYGGDLTKLILGSIPEEDRKLGMDTILVSDVKLLPGKRPGEVVLSAVVSYFAKKDNEAGSKTSLSKRLMPTNGYPSNFSLTEEEWNLLEKGLATAETEKPVAFTIAKKHEGSQSPNSKQLEGMTAEQLEALYKPIYPNAIPQQEAETPKGPSKKREITDEEAFSILSEAAGHSEQSIQPTTEFEIVPETEPDSARKIKELPWDIVAPLHGISVNPPKDPDPRKRQSQDSTDSTLSDLLATM